MDYFENKEGMPVLRAIIKGIQNNKEYLSEVDGLIGDGDHGVNMNKGFTLFESRLKGENLSFSEGLNELGMVLFNEIGGSMGPIYGTIFSEMGEAAESCDQIFLKDFAAILESGLKGLQEIVEAKPGDKTLVDALSPAVKSLRDSAAREMSFREALDYMKAAAEEGKDATKGMIAKFGRSSRLGERSRGVLDAGAVSCCIILQSMADEIKNQLHTERR